MQPPRFYKIIVDPQCHTLRIPTKFTRRHRDDLPDTVFLKVPNGSKLWEVGLIRAEDGEIWLENGWEQFRDYYFMQFGHLLLFQFHAESSKFDVWIFDKTATEIEYPLDHAGSSEGIPSSVLEKSSGDHRTENTDHLGGSCKGTASKRFTKKLMMCNAYRVLLPRDFSEGTGITTNKEITVLDVNGRKWPVHANCMRNGQYEICAGWNSFLTNNKVSIGSTMLFTFIPSADNTIEARVVKTGPNEKKLFNYVKRRGGKDQFVASLATRDRARRPQIVSPTIVPALDEGDEYEVHDSAVSLGEISKSQKGKERGRRRPKTGSLLGHPFRRSARGAKVGVKVTTLDSRNRFNDQGGGSSIGMTLEFTKQLTTYNAYRLVLPKEFTESTGITEDSEIMVQDVKGRKWPVRVIYKGRGRYNITAGWKNFLTSNDVTIGSTISLSVVPGSTNTIEARVVKSGMDKKKLFNNVKRRRGRIQFIASLATHDHERRRPKSTCASVDHANNEGNEYEAHDSVAFLRDFSKSKKGTVPMTGRKRQKAGDLIDSSVRKSDRNAKRGVNYHTENTDNEDSFNDQGGRSSIGLALQFSTRLTTYNAYRLVLPKKLTGGAGITADSDIMVQDVKGRKWPVSLVCKSRGRYELSGGWNNFLTKNDITVGSSMSFTFIPNSDNTIEARVVKMGTDKKKLFKYVKRRGGRHHFLASLAAQDHAKRPRTVSSIVDHAMLMRGTKRPKTRDLLENPVRKSSRKANLVDSQIETTDDEHSFNEQGGGSSTGMSWGFTRQLMTHNAYRLVIPKEFIESTGLTSDSEMMVRDAKGREWPVRVKWRKPDRYDICAGWNDFLSNNDVIIGSTMSFTFVPSSDNTMEARVVKRGTDKRKLFKYVKNRGGKVHFISSLAIRDHARRPKIISSSVVHAHDEGNKYESHNSVVSSRENFKSQKGKENIVEHCWTRTLPMTGRKRPNSGDILGNPSRKSARKMELGGGHHTENTFHDPRGEASIDLCLGFTRQLTTCNAHRLILPREFIESTGITADSEIMVRNVKGRKWPVHVIGRKHGRYEICAGWNNFLKDNDLIIGNTISLTFISCSNNIIEVQVVKTGMVSDKPSANQ